MIGNSEAAVNSPCGMALKMKRAAALLTLGVVCAVASACVNQEAESALATRELAPLSVTPFAQHAPEPDTVSIVAEPDPRTIISVVEEDGASASTPGSNEPIPALSQAKLFLGYWVMVNEPGRTDEVVAMIENSDDGIADELDAEYPNAIEEVITTFGLANTTYNGYWGQTITTTEDLATFMHRICQEPEGEALRDAMANVSAVAADGYAQDYGTAQLPWILGTKFGWADDLTAHSTASFGRGFVIVAYTYGSAEELTQDVLASVEVVHNEPSGPASATTST